MVRQRCTIGQDPDPWVGEIMATVASLSTPHTSTSARAGQVAVKNASSTRLLSLSSMIAKTKRPASSFALAERDVGTWIVALWAVIVTGINKEVALFSTAFFLASLVLLFYFGVSRPGGDTLEPIDYASIRTA